MGKISDIEWLEIKGLIPYENNSKKHSEKQINLIAKSIEEFGFLSPILIDENNGIIAGHGRTQAATLLGMKKVPCVRCEGLTEDQRRAYVIADNKLTELGGWDKDMVAAELSLLDINGFDVDITGFDISTLDELSLNIPKAYGAERERTAKAYNMDIADQVQSGSDYWEMPLIKKQDFVPDNLIGFNYAKTSKDKECGIHFFLDDYQFERIWNSPEKYVDILKEYQCVISPEFSLYWDMPLPMKIWNTYRNRFIGSYLQEKGITVIPSICWADEKSFDFCFEGVERGSIVAVETNGVKEQEETLERWRAGMDELIERIGPSKILIYGGAIEYDFGDIEVVYFENKVLKKWKDGND